MGEKWREVYTEEQLKKVQEIGLKNLITLKNVCDELGIEFFLYGGTLIGAVRHKGFVPWDDDVDVGMTRENYERFLKEAPKVLPDNYFLQTPYSEKASPYLYSKLRLKNTKYIEYGHHKLDIEKGIYIDIYPVDNAPDDDGLLEKQHGKIKKIINLFVLRQCEYTTKPPKTVIKKLRAIAKFLIAYALRLIPQQIYVNKIKKEMTRFNNEGTTRMVSWFYPKKDNLFPRLFPLQETEFEGIKLKIPACWEEHLRMRYGNFMEFPPPEERIGHKPYMLDFGDKNE